MWKEQLESAATEGPCVPVASSIPSCRQSSAFICIFYNIEEHIKHNNIKVNPKSFVRVILVFKCILFVVTTIVFPY